ncbi:uncharacterized protein LOC113306107 [Papaver somniferum]|uniref:uncharacterized protein LOC113306107 n=1 Tax=Papaver somniferum TaxID=3469 RepID=UPI000E7028E8|nr:uncharacterized protein LOC113306107 [Papaver somniferum]
MKFLIIPNSETQWKELWHINTCPRVKHFWWKCLVDILPTNVRLQRSCRYINNIFPLCKQFYEEVTHVLFTCPFSRAVWMRIPGGSSVLVGLHTNIAVVFESWVKLSQQSISNSNWLNLAIIVSWSIWNERCEVQFQNKKANPELVSRKAMSFAAYIEGLNVKQQTRVVMIHDNIHAHWKPPAYPYLTINCDAYFDKHTGLTGIALVLRDFVGQWRGCSTKCYAGVKDSEHAECLAFLEVFKWNRNMQQTHVVLETDLQGIESYITKHAPVISWEYEDILLDAIECLKNIPHWECHFFSISCNKPADILAKYNSRNRVTRVWLDKPPDFIESSLLEDIVTVSS